MMVLRDAAVPSHVSVVHVLATHLEYSLVQKSRDARPWETARRVLPLRGLGHPCGTAVVIRYVGHHGHSSA